MKVFYGKLREYGITNVDDSVKRRLLMFYYLRIMAASLPSVDASFAYEVYQDARRLPGTDTRVAMLGNLDIAIDGPIFEGTSFILSAVDLKTGRLLALKLLPTHEKSMVSAAEAEKRAVGALGLDALYEGHWEGPAPDQEPLPLMPTKIVMVDILDNPTAVELGLGKQRHESLIMPRLGSSLARLPQLTEPLLHRGGRRLQAAVRRLHAASLIHADLKSDNCIVDASGHWFLSDFGSSVPIGDKIASTTETWSPSSIMFQPAQPRHDWALLLVLLAVELDKGSLDGLVRPPSRDGGGGGGARRVDRDLVLQRCRGAKDPELKVLLGELASLAEWAEDETGQGATA